MKKPSVATRKPTLISIALDLETVKGRLLNLERNGANPPNVVWKCPDCSHIHHWVWDTCDTLELGDSLPMSCDGCKREFEVYRVRDGHIAAPREEE